MDYEGKLGKSVEKYKKIIINNNTYQLIELLLNSKYLFLKG
jgi:hypothetical protein